MKTPRPFACRSLQALSLAGAILAAGGPALADAGHAHGGRSIGEPAEASTATRTVRVKLRDSYYEPKTIEIKAGETVRFVLTNAGELLHEFSIATAAMHAEHRKEMQAMADAGMLTETGLKHEAAHEHHATEGMPMKHDDPNSVLLAPGETKELVWKFPNDAELQFACNLPGHYEAGMVGEFKFSR